MANVYNPTIYGRRMEIRRAEIGFSQVDLAEKVGTTRQCISNYEAGQRKPDIDMLVKIAKALNTSTDYLLGLTGSGSTNADKRQVGDITGLSDEAVETLAYFKGSTANEFINFALESDEAISFKDQISEVARYAKEAATTEQLYIINRISFMDLFTCNFNYAEKALAKALSDFFKDDWAKVGTHFLDLQTRHIRADTENNK